MSKTKVLLIDDDTVLLSFMKKSLGTTGEMEIHVESNSTLAVQAAVKLAPDIVVLDINMPGMDGGDVMHALREDAATKDIPVLLLTSLAIKNEARGRQDAKAEEYYVAKPIDGAELARHIEQRLGRKIQPPCVLGAEPLHEPAGTAGGKDHPTTAKKRVLIVDDDEVVGLIIANIARRRGADPVVVTDGRRAQELLREVGPFDAIFLDLLLPHASGWEILEGVRSDPRTRDTPVFIVSGAPISSQEKEKLAGKVTAFVSKETFSLAEFVRLVEGVLTKKANGGSAHTTRRGPVEGRATARPGR